MRLNTTFTALSLFVTACGGGNNSPVILIDSPTVDIDAPVSNVCPVTPDIPNLRLMAQNAMGEPDMGPDGIPGTADDVPLANNVCGQSGTDPCDWFSTLQGGGNMGRKVFFLLAGLPPRADNNPSTTTDNLLGIELNPIAGVTAFPTQRQAFTTAPDAIGSAVVFDQAGNPATATYTAIAYILGNVDNGGMFTHLYTSTSGGVTFLSGGDAVDTVIRGHVETSVLTETDGVALVDGGCTTNLDLSFAITQGNAAAKRDTGEGAGNLGQHRAQMIYNNILRKTGRM